MLATGRAEYVRSGATAMQADLGRPGFEAEPEDAELDRQMTQQLHFGGGFMPKQGLQAHEQPEEELPRRSKKEVRAHTQHDGSAST